MTTEKKFYVTMSDMFMSGWGEAKGKINKLIFVCDTIDEAQIVKDNAEQRSDQRYIYIRTSKPRYNPQRYLVQYKTKGDYAAWYIKNFFRKQRYYREAL